jgi:hypothetical protein
MKSLLLLFVFLLLIPLTPQAEGDLHTRKEVFSFLQAGFNAQVSLSEQLRTKEEVNELLSPFFSEKYQNIFWKENIVQEEGGYVAYGTDFARYYIPYYHFSKQTKVEIGSEEIFVYEYFPANAEGPASYQSHYEGVLLKKISGEWKINQYLNETHLKSILEKAGKTKKTQAHFFSNLSFRPLSK